jgi:hypothetical protein
MAGGVGRARSEGFRTIHALVSRARRSVKRCDAEPGPLPAQHTPVVPAKAGTHKRKRRGQ